MRTIAAERKNRWAGRLTKLMRLTLVFCLLLTACCGPTTAMRLVRFDGNGQLDDVRVKTGSVLLLVQDGQVSVVLLEVLQPEELGPTLHPAVNQDALAADALRVVRGWRPDLLESDRAWTTTCPDSLAARAVFQR